MQCKYSKNYHSTLNTMIKECDLLKIILYDATIKNLIFIMLENIYKKEI